MVLHRSAGALEVQCIKQPGACLPLFVARGPELWMRTCCPPIAEASNALTLHVSCVEDEREADPALTAGYQRGYECILTGLRSTCMAGCTCCGREGARRVSSAGNTWPRRRLQVDVVRTVHADNVNRIKRFVGGCSMQSNQFRGAWR